MHKTVVLDLSR